MEQWSTLCNVLGRDVYTFACLSWVCKVHLLNRKHAYKGRGQTSFVREHPYGVWHQLEMQYSYYLMECLNISGAFVFCIACVYSTAALNQWEHSGKWYLVENFCPNGTEFEWLKAGIKCAHHLSSVAVKDIAKLISVFIQPWGMRQWGLWDVCSTKANVPL